MLRVSEKDARRIIKSGRFRITKKRRNKYGAIRTTLNGIKFASKREAKRYQHLIKRQLADEITGLSLQPDYEIIINGFLVCRVVLDFKYFEFRTKTWIIEDSKGRDNAVSKLKRKMVEAAHNIKVTIV